MYEMPLMALIVLPWGVEADKIDIYFVVGMERKKDNVEKRGEEEEVGR